jgi:hypothetical protein
MNKLPFLFVFLAILTTGCEEITPPINLDFTYTGRRVIVEEFTGVQCVNCPEGSKRLEELSNLHGEFVIPISIHAGSFSAPYPSSLYDFRTPEGTNLERNLLGPVQGFPAAVVNRRLFNNEDEKPITINKWAGYIAQELIQQPKLEVTINNSFDTTSRNLAVDVQLNFIETVTKPVGISVMILEDGISDYQLTPDKSVYPDGKDPYYKHKHVLRTMLTDYTGDAISFTQTKTGSSSTFSYNFTIPTEWKAEDCEVVAFVSYKGATDDNGNEILDVLQANKEKVID